MSLERDRVFMEHAIEIGRCGRFWSAPNPPVGCVLVQRDTIVATGFTQPAGQPHAEIMALQAIDDARGMTAYVTLEPCNHHGRTPPCTEALIQAGISRVVVALEDPNPEVSGQGIARLRGADITVEVGLLADEVEADLAGFLLRMRRGWGRITLKVATSLDGRTAMASGESQWITGETARRDVQLWRAQSDAIVTGVNTVMTDNCKLTLRAHDLPLQDADKSRALAYPPTRIVLDSKGMHQHCWSTHRYQSHQDKDQNCFHFDYHPSRRHHHRTIVSCREGMHLDCFRFDCHHNHHRPYRTIV